MRYAVFLVALMWALTASASSGDVSMSYSRSSYNPSQMDVTLTNSGSYWEVCRVSVSNGANGANVPPHGSATIYLNGVPPLDTPSLSCQADVR